MTDTIPKAVKEILEKLEAEGFEAFLVGGCVRDLLLGKEPKDWDVATNAKPEEIQKLFPDSFYENEFGTVGVKVREHDAEEVKLVIEVTPYRKEAKYSDKRHPDKVEFTGKLEDDLARRDFTVNAMAMDGKGEVRDPFEGQKDLEEKIIRAVGVPEERFAEDALRLMRAVRFAAQLNFTIEKKTKDAVKKNADSLAEISKERIRDELVKIIDSSGAEQGVRKLHELGLLPHIIPELEVGVGVEQNLHHIYTVFEHNVRSLEFAVKHGSNVFVRFAALLHDVAKPHTKGGEGKNATFYGHEMVGARMTKKILERLHFSREFITKVVALVRYHMFYYDVGEVTERSVRRLVKRVGPENIDELLEVRMAERKGSGVPKAEPYRLRHLRYMIEKVSKDPLTVGMLAVKGDEIMKELAIEPGPRVGMILNALLEEVLDDPKRNTTGDLAPRIKKLH